MAAAGLLAASCTDFDDYNESYTSGSSESKLTLWENIQSNGNLTQFTELVKKSGFDRELGSSHYYTVWAPLDGTFDDDYSLYSQADASTLLYKFVKSHIANYGHTASGVIDEKVHTLNEKSFAFAGNGTYTYDRSTLEGVNLPNINGVLHTINGAVEFLPNIYEYIFEAEGSDLIKEYFKKYQTETLNLSKSVEGAIVDGVQTYLDSVMDVSNSMTNSLRAYVAREDSNYTMILPSDKAYQDAYDRIKAYYKYGSKVAYQNLGSLDENVRSQKVDNEYLADSLSRLVIARSLFMNRNAAYNKWINGQFNPRWPVDTIQTTAGIYLTNGPQIQSLVTDTVRASNGSVWLVDTLAQYPWDNWCKPITIAATRSETRAKILSATGRTVRVTENEIDKTKIGPDENGEYTGITYLDLMVDGDRAKSQTFFYVPGVQSTTYNVYVVMVPANIELGSTATPKQYKFNVDMFYSSADGSKMETVTLCKDMLSDSTRVDTVMVGTVTFPTAYNSIPIEGSNKVYPYIKIASNRSAISKTEWEYIDNRLRIASIIFRPVEYDEYRKSLLNKPEDDE